MSEVKIMLSDLNLCDEEEFVRICGRFFEQSPWIARRTFALRPFSHLDTLHSALCQTVRSASVDERVGLIASHPDLVGRLAREEKLSRESTAEQSAAGLDRLSPADVSAFERFNADYRRKFGFPFVICARENRKDAILAAFPVRLGNTRDAEIETALFEITKIARLRLLDAVAEG
jgi:OHCU decarboxylase